MDRIKPVVEVLIALRTEMHGKLEDRAIDRMDEVISILEKLEYDKSLQGDPKLKLKLFGSVVEMLPSIVKAIEYLSEVLK